MGISIDGQICYGVLFEEGYEFPWDCDEYHYDIEEWWLKTFIKFTPSVELFTEDGDYINGREPTDEEFNKYFKEKQTALKDNPLPIELVNYCSGKYPEYILAAPSTYFVANHGDPTHFEPELLQIASHERQALTDFCEQFSLEYSGAPAWYLSSYYG